MARYFRLFLASLCVTTLAGCIWPEEVESSSWMKQFKSQPYAPTNALIEFAIIERPLDDEYLNQGIWKHTDELFAGLEKRGVLEDNGFRVGQLVGAPQHELQQLLLSKESCRDPQAWMVPAGKTRTIRISAVQPKAAYDLANGGERVTLEFDQAQHCLDVTARFDSVGRTVLTMTPKIEHAGAALPFKASPEQMTWELRTDKPARLFTELSWEVTLGPNEYIFIGGRMNRPRSPGQGAFTHSDIRGDLQRLLVIRNCRSTTPAHDADANSTDKGASTTPLALQAAVPPARAKSN